MTATARDRKTARERAGVRVKADHWASSTVHAFHRWTGETTLLTWCGIEVNLADGGAFTPDLINCLQCPQASLQEFFRGAA